MLLINPKKKLRYKLFAIAVNDNLNFRKNSKMDLTCHIGVWSSWHSLFHDKVYELLLNARKVCVTLCDFW